MAGEKTLASLVILTDSVRVLQEHVNTGHVFKTANRVQYPNCHSKDGKEKLSPDEDVVNNPESDEFLKLPSDEDVSNNHESNQFLKLSPDEDVSNNNELDQFLKLSPDKDVSDNHELDEFLKLSSDEDMSNNHASDELVKLSPEECVFGNFELGDLNNKITKPQLLFSDQTESDMKFERIAEDSNSSEDSESEHVPFENEQEAASTEESFASFCSNKNTPLKTYSKWRVRNNDKQFDRLKLVFSKENITELPHSNKWKSDVPKYCSSSSQIGDSENKLCPPIEKLKLCLQKLTKNTTEKENLKTLAKSSERTAVSCSDLAHELESECTISLRKGSQVRKSEKINSRSKRLSHSKKVEAKRGLHKCVKCEKFMRNITCVSKYVFKNCSAAKSRKCQKCRMEKVESRKKFSQK